jgi:hypothetical protein
MGLVVLEWQQVRRTQPLAAGLCWSLAMIKPQIALLHGAPLLVYKGLRSGLWAGLLGLALLSAFAFLHTGFSPLTYGARFFRLLGKVQDDSGWNLALQVSQGGVGLWVGLGAALVAGIVALVRWCPRGSWLTAARSRLMDPERWMIQAGLCSLLGYLAVYHRSTDHIMLAPALLAMADLSWRGRRLGVTALSLLLGASLWTPGRLILVSPILPLAQTGIWVLSALVLAAAMVAPRPLQRLDE